MCFVTNICFINHIFAEKVTEDKIKAVLLLKFPLFIEWPEKAFNDNVKTFKIGVLGDTLVIDSLLTFNGKPIKGKILIVQQFKSVYDVKQCHVLYISPMNSKKLQKVIKVLKNKPVLLVGSQKGFSENGGIINFFIQSDKVKFEINHDVGIQRGFKISSKLLKLARIVSNP